MTQKRLKREVRPAYVKVAEYQRRGLVHLHVLVRLDRAMPEYRADELQPAAARASPSSCSRTRVRAAVAEVSAPGAGGARRRARALGRRARRPPARRGDERGEVAGYLAKYATKSTEQAGGAAAPRRPEHVEHAPGARARARASCAPRSTARPGRSRRCDRRAAIRGWRVRARLRLPRPLPDQEPPLLHDLQGAARRRARPTCTSSCSPAPATRRSARSPRATSGSCISASTASGPRHSCRRVPGGFSGGAGARAPSIGA